ncbi:MAG: exodeoxyribonuclease VII small subunit [Clostridiaceae bacterium]|nr:exodeoxyribonuclease VII small subunit [Clostridiaceae bacterium]
MAAKKQTFESSMARLEEIVRKMEQGDTPLDDSVALFEEGTKLAASLHKMLDEAEQKVTILRPQPDGSVQESPFIQEEP